MSKYRDLYSPYDTETIIDTDGSIYDSNQEEVGKWGNGPYKGYIRHTFADGYDYCGDDDYNAYAMKYNDALRKRLATKGGQMSYDWEHRFDNDDSYWTPEQIKRYEKDLRGTRDYENQLNNVIGKLKRDDYIHDENNNCDWFEKELKRVRNSYNRFSNM